MYGLFNLERMYWEFPGIKAHMLSFPKYIYPLECDCPHVDETYKCQWLPGTAVSVCRLAHETRN